MEFENLKVKQFAKINLGEPFPLLPLVTTVSDRFFYSTMSLAPMFFDY